MPAQQRAAALVISVMAGTCVMLAGCGGSSSSSGGQSANGQAPASPTVSPSGTSGGGTSGGISGSGAKLTGNFCTDFKNIGQNIKLPPNATGSPADLKQHGVQYLDQAAAYFNKLAAEAPLHAGNELHVIASDYEAMAASISNGNIGSLTKIEQRMVSLTTQGAAGNAFRQLISYMVTKCTAA